MSYLCLQKEISKKKICRLMINMNELIKHGRVALIVHVMNEIRNTS